MTRDLAGVDAQARDISFLIDYARRLPNTDISKVAVVGYSWGGLANLFAAARDPRIEALVALDGSLRYFPGLVARAGDVHPERMTIPLLYFKAGDWSLEDEARYMTPEESEGANVLNAWTRGDLVVVRMLGMTHWEFSSMYQRNEETWKDYPKWQIADYRREDGITGYLWMARYTLAFLDAYLKRDAQSAAFLGNTPAQNAAPSHFMEVEVRRADAHDLSDTGE
jgi:pimeloyl-ACP methyl ester carboxylesterase